MSISESSRLRRKDECVGVEFEDGQIMLDVEAGKYFEMNPVAGWVWDQLEDGCSFADLCQQAVASFDVTADECRRDLTDLLADLETRGLVEKS